MEKYISKKPLPPCWFKGKSFSVVIVEIEGEGFQAYSSDAKGLFGEGATVEECKALFARHVELRLLDGLGGIYYGRSSYEHQMTSLENLMKYWEEDNVKMIGCWPCEITMFGRDSPYLQEVTRMKLITRPHQK